MKNINPVFKQLLKPFAPKSEDEIKEDVVLIEKELPTGVTTKQPKSGGRIKVELKDYDTYFDQRTVESECSNNTVLLLAQNFRDIKL